MTAANKAHLKKVIVWGGGASVVIAALSLIKFPLVVAGGVLTGATLSAFNIYSIIMVVEALAGAATSGAGKSVKALAVIVHVLKLGLVFAILLALVLFKLTNLPAFLVGFTIVLTANLLVGLGGIAKGNIS